MIIMDGPTGVMDIDGNELHIGEEVFMWRPYTIERVILTKYNQETGMMGVELVNKSTAKYTSNRFSTPYDGGKFAKVNP